MYGQQEVNDYKYIIVPKQFDAFKEQNAHQTSTLVKYLLNEKGFLVVYDDALPEELNRNRCLGLLVSLVDDSSMFTTKAALALKNCNGEKLFETLQGKSRNKEYKVAYSEAIKQAMLSFNSINYVYNGKVENTEPITVSFKNDVKTLKEDKKEQSSAIAAKEPEVETTIKNPMVAQEATTENQLYDSKEPVSSNIKEAKSKEIKKLKILKPEKDEIWYAQSLPNGYQLVDSAPKIRMKLLKSSSDNVYIAQGDNKSGMVYQKEGKWIFEYYEGDKLMQKELNIKF